MGGKKSKHEKSQMWEFHYLKNLGQANKFNIIFIVSTQTYPKPTIIPLAMKLVLTSVIMYEIIKDDSKNSILYTFRRYINEDSNYNMINGNKHIQGEISTSRGPWVNKSLGPLHYVCSPTGLYLNLLIYLFLFYQGP